MMQMDVGFPKHLHYAYDVYNRNVSVTGDDFTQKNHYDAEGLPRFHHRKGQGHKLCISGWNAPTHIHIMDENKNSLDINGKIVSPKDPSGHIPYND